MALFEYQGLLLAQIILIIISINWFLRRNDVIPLLISCFLSYVASYRYWSVTSGLNSWVHVVDQISNNVENDALNALAYIVLGQICLLGTYWNCRKQSIPIAKIENSSSLFTWLRPKVLFFGLLCLPLVIAIRSSVISQVQGGRSLAFEVSGYIYLFPMVLVGIAVLTITLWKFGGLTTLFHKILATAILIGVFQLTFTPGSRFQFVGWIIASGIILSSVYQPKKRLLILGVAAAISLSLFAVAGAMRQTNLSEITLEEASIARAFNAEDANMLDGFVIVKNVFPQHLDFRWGMEHLEILLRPIPRSIWPEKPVGGSYMEYLGLSNANKGTTVGFSPTLFGSFYVDGGLIGIIVLSLIYGRALAGIVKYSISLQPFAGVIVRAIVCACLIPLLRGGDLAGVYAWIGMAFWPCFLLLRIKRRELRNIIVLPRQYLASYVKTKYPYQ